MIDPGSKDGWSASERPPIIDFYERTLQPLIGFLSNFIVRKQYEKVTMKGSAAMDRARARKLMDHVLDEVGLLIGPTQTMDLKLKLTSINEEFYPTEAVNEG